MLVACWSSKGGSGATVAAVALAAGLARRGVAPLLVDLAGDVPAVLGLDDVDPGVAAWLAAGPEVPAGSLARLEVPAAGGLRVLPLGAAVAGGGSGVGALAAAGPRADVLAAVLAADPRVVVADCGTSPAGAALAVAAAADVSLLVVRACFVSLRRARLAPLRPTGVVLVREAWRALGAADVEAALGAPVVAEVPVHEAVARAVDAGTLASRLPRSLARALRHVA